MAGALLSLLLALVGGYAIGRSTANPAASSATPGPAPFGHRHAVDVVGGLAVSANGYTLVSDTTTFVPGTPRDFTFQVRDGDGRAVQAFEVVHDKPMHMVVVRADLAGYQHLHPTMGGDGTWTVPLTLPTAGVWRAYLDFTAKDASARLTPAILGINLNAAGTYNPVAAATPVGEWTLGPATVSWQGTPRVNVMSPIDVRVSRSDGGSVSLGRYLGAYGHLVLIRESDLGYLHFHASNETATETLRFYAYVPSSGRYRAYVDLRLDGVVRTAEFTVQVG